MIAEETQALACDSGTTRTGPPVRMDQIILLVVISAVAFTVGATQFLVHAGAKTSGFEAFLEPAFAVSLVSLALYAFRRNHLLGQKSNELLQLQEIELGFQKRVLDEHAAVTIADARGRITYVNDKFLEMSGYSRDELIGKSHSVQNSGRHSRAFFQDMWSTILSGKTWNGEVMNRHKDGSKYWVKCTIVPSIGKDGKPEKFVSLRTDITDVKNAERQRQLAASFDFIDDEVYMLWPDSLQFFFANRAARQHTGLSLEDICKLTPMDTFRGVTRERVNEIIRPIVEGKEHSVSFCTKHRHFNGDLITASVVVQLIKPEHEKPHLVAVIRDISKEVEAERHVVEVYKTLDLMPDSVSVIDPVTLKFVYINQATKKRFGWSDSEYREKGPLDVLTSYDEPSYRRMIAPLVSGEKSHIELEVVDDKGVPIKADLHIAKPGTDKARLVTIGQNISERLDFQERIRDLEATLDYVTDEIYMFWPDTKKFFYANRSALQRNGLSLAEIQNLTPAKLPGSLIGEGCGSNLIPMSEGKTCCASFEREFEGDDGTTTVKEVAVQLVEPEGQKPRFMAVIKDISEQKEAQDEAEILSHSLDLIKDEVYLFWADSYEFIYLNDNAATRTAIHTPSWRDHTVGDFITQDQFELLKQRCNALTAGPKRRQSYEIEDRDGRTLEIYLHLIEPEGAKPRFLAIYRDITARKAADKMKDEFVSTVSHELRTPLTSIKGALGLIAAGVAGDLPDKASSLVSVADKNCSRLVLLVNDLLDLNKLRSGKVELCRERLDLASLLHDAIDANLGYAKEYGVSFITTRVDQGTFVAGDKARLMQVLDNLMSNAAKFSASGDSIELSLARRHGEVCISVKDHGCGIPIESQGKIFERFTQADSSDSRQKGGTGLGLSIAKSIVELHGGEISFVSEAGKGTEFFVKLKHLADDDCLVVSG